ncbi:MAG: alpha-amylase family glycosyl hydrolase [Oscillospiraceae bacterium]|nr:alpha-amylase family glycosyl hydrolase [Oscillospiraceae bacterium]
MSKWLKDAIFYEIYPQTFHDSNGDGIGDIPGILQKLDYIQEMGFNAIWLNPCYDSPFWDAGYDVRDHKKVAPRYGTNEDLYELFREAHRRDMRVILDLVPGHTSIDHSWFTKACEPEHNEFSNRFIFSPSVWELPEGYRWVSGYAQRDGNFMINFFSTQPALNYGFSDINAPKWQMPPEHPDCRKTLEAMKDIMRFWLSKGADGFRVDMADCLVKNDESKAATSKLWQEIRAMLDLEYPQAALVAEWSYPERAINMAGFHMDFYLDHFHNGYHALVRSRKDDANDCYVSRDGRGDITRFTSDFIPKYEATKKDGYISFITCNHDTPRLTRHLSIPEIKLAYAMIFTLPGVPFLYYGDEIGMRYIENLPSKEGGYSRTGTRTPMQWSSGKNLGFSTADPSLLYLPVDSAADAPTVQSQKNDDLSLLNTVKALISLRKSSDDFGAGGDFEVIHAAKGDPLFVYRRGDHYILVNPSLSDIAYDLPPASGRQAAKPNAPQNDSHKSAKREIIFKLGNCVMKGEKATLSPQSFAALR